MTIEQLLDCSAEQLEKMKDEELLKHFQKYLNVTRPELVVREKPKSPAYVEPMTDKKRALLEMLASNGVDTGALMKHRNKKK